MTPRDFLTSEPDLLALQQLVMAELFQDLGLNSRSLQMIKAAENVAGRYGIVKNALEKIKKQNAADCGTDSESPQLTDFFQFYQSARYFLQGESIYTPILFYPSEKFIARMTDKAKESIKYLFPNMNSPLHTFFMTPFAILPFPQAFWSWSILSLLFGFLAVGLIILNATTQLPNKFTSFLNLSIILLGYFPTFANNMLGGQWGLCLLLFVVLIWHTARREKYMSAGIILGIAMSSKIIFALFLLYFFMSRMWKILAWSLSTFSIMNIIGIFIFGIPEYKQHILNLETVPQFINASWNASCAAFFSRIFGGAENIPLVMIPSLAHALSFVFFGAFNYRCY